MTHEDPRPVADVDEHLRAAVRDFHRTRWLAVLALLVMLCTSVIVLGVLFIRQDARLTASCGFWRVLTPLPVLNVPGKAHPSRLSILLVTGSRDAYRGQRCGTLPPADPSVTRGAAYYKIRVP